MNQPFQKPGAKVLPCVRPPSEFYAHPKAIVESDAIGPGTRIWAFAHVLPGAIVGRDCNLCDHTFLEGDVRLGDRVTVKSGVYLWAGAVIEDDVFLGPNATFTNDIRPRSKQYPQQPVGVRVERGASVGAGAILLPGVTIGRYAMVGAGAVVTRDVAPHALVYGNPARQHGWVCRCGANLASMVELPWCDACRAGQSEGATDAPETWRKAS